MALEDILHDGIDDQEELSERAQQIVESLKPEIIKMIAQSDSIEEGLERAAAFVADKMADVTTDAVQKGRQLGSRLV